MEHADSDISALGEKVMASTADLTGATSPVPLILAIRSATAGASWDGPLISENTGPNRHSAIWRVVAAIGPWVVEANNGEEGAEGHDHHVTLHKMRDLQGVEVGPVTHCNDHGSTRADYRFVYPTGEITLSPATSLYGKPLERYENLAAYLLERGS